MTQRSRFIIGSMAIAGAIATVAALGFAIGGDAHYFRRGTWCAHVLSAMACAAGAAWLATRRGLDAWQGRPFALSITVVLVAYAGFALCALAITTIDHALVFTDAPQWVFPSGENVAFVMFFLIFYTACIGLLPALGLEHVFCRRLLKRERTSGAVS